MTVNLLWPLASLLWRRNLARLTLHLVCIIGAVWLYRGLLVFLLNVDQAYIYAAFDTRLDHLMDLLPADNTVPGEKSFGVTARCFATDDRDCLDGHRCYRFLLFD